MMRIMAIDIQQALFADADARSLVAALDAELSGEYSPEQSHGLSFEKLFRPNIFFFIARLDGKAAGCGGIAVESDFAEVKRMYVRPEARGKQIAQALMNRLESEARAKGVKRLLLETGDVRHAAIKFYTRCGFSPCVAFGDYLKMCPSAIERSVFFEKRVG